MGKFDSCLWLFFLFFLFFWDSDNTNITFMLYQKTILSQSTSYLEFSQSNFCYSTFQFTDSFFCPFYSTVEFIHWVFHFGFIVFSSKLSIWFFFIASIYLLRFYSFSFISFIHKSSFIMASWKSLWNNVHICVVLVLPSVGCLNLLRLRFFLVEQAVFDCILGILGIML